MERNPFKISPEAKSSIESEVTEVIDGLITQLKSYIEDYDLQDAVDVETSHLEREWIENLAEFDLDSFAEVIQSGFIKNTPIDFTPRSIALYLAALQLKRERVTNKE